MTESILATIFWLLIFLALPIALMLATLSVWADGAGAVGGKPEFNNAIVVVILIVYSAIWILLLRTIYLPAMGYDPAVLSPATYSRFATLLSLQQLLTAFTTWISQSLVSAGLHMLLFAALVVATLLLARFIGQWSGRRTRGY